MVPDEIRVEDLPPVCCGDYIIIFDRSGMQFSVYRDVPLGIAQGGWLNKVNYSNRGPFKVVKYAAVEVAQEGGSDG